MILKKYIESDLKRLNSLYLSSVLGPDLKVPIFYSKLAVLELSGWVEESFDLIAKRAIRGKLKEDRFKKLLDNAIDGNHGFDYHNNFISMMSKIVGLGSCEALDSHLTSSGKCAILTSEISAVLGQRRRAAHVHLAATTLPFDSPSVTLVRLSKLYPVLREMYQWFC